MKITNDCRVELGYTISSPEGELLEQSEDSGPLEYRHGQGQLPQPLEKALEGRTVGETVEVSLGPGEAFGTYDPKEIVSVPRDEFPADAELVPGDWITVTVEEGEGDPPAGEGAGEGQELEMRVVEVTPEAVVLDANHPLADQPVIFKIEVLSVREE